MINLKEFSVLSPQLFCVFSIIWCLFYYSKLLSFVLCLFFKQNTKYTLLLSHHWRKVVKRICRCKMKCSSFHSDLVWPCKPVLIQEHLIRYQRKIKPIYLFAWNSSIAVTFSRIRNTDRHRNLWRTLFLYLNRFVLSLPVCRFHST